MLVSRPKTAVSGGRVSIHSNEPLEEMLKDAGKAEVSI